VRSLGYTLQQGRGSVENRARYSTKGETSREFSREEAASTGDTGSAGSSFNRSYRDLRRSIDEEHKQAAGDQTSIIPGPRYFPAWELGIVNQDLDHYASDITAANNTAIVTLPPRSTQRYDRPGACSLRLLEATLRKALQMRPE